MTEPHPDDLAREEARSIISGAIGRMTRKAGGHLHERPAWRGSTVTLSEPEPAAGIRYALMLRSAAEAQAFTSIRRARGDGMSWQQIGELLKPALGWDAGGWHLGEVAYEYATDAEHAEAFSRLSFYWDCGTCGQGITDRGPYESHPEDNEQGHAADCSRMAAMVAEHDARMADE